MDILEKLYNCADQHLNAPMEKWSGFASKFQGIFNADMILYRVLFEPDFQTIRSFEAISTSRPKTAAEYINQKLYAHHPLPEASLAPLEPMRRTDTMTNDELRQLEFFWKFIEEHGYFYQMIVPAILQDGTFIGLVVWRDEENPDFNDREKQRLALFMRHLLAIVDAKKFSKVETDDDVTTYGKKYGLTKTEIEVLSALLQGQSLKIIAQTTNRTYGTVRWHVQNILEKCQVSSQKNLLRDFYHLIKA